MEQLQLVNRAIVIGSLAVIAILLFWIIYVAFIMLRSFIRPLYEVLDNIEKINEGTYDFGAVAANGIEMQTLCQTLQTMADTVHQRIQETKEKAHLKQLLLEKENESLHKDELLARSEFKMLQNQINPHFLYNTLDAVSALALMKENEKCFEITQALGNFYRNSLNSGLDYITMEDEIDSIKSYITILNMRYENQIKMDYQIEESVKKEKILKLLLQPLVENAVHHGLNGAEGTVSIKAFSQDDEIIFIVSDDGVGMSEDRVEAILHGKNITGKSGFGLHSLIQRIRLLYEIENPIIIQSEIGNGTEIIVTVKKMKGENYIC